MDRIGIKIIKAIIDKLKNVFKSIFNINSKDFDDMYEAELMVTLLKT